MGQAPMQDHSANQKVTPLHLLSERPEYVDCQFCKKRTRTRVETKGTALQVYVLVFYSLTSTSSGYPLSWSPLLTCDDPGFSVTGAVLCFICICLTPLPCILHWFEQTNWYCEQCGKQIATRTPNSQIYVIPPPEVASQPSQYATQPGQGPPPPHMNPQSPATPGSGPVSPPAGSPLPQQQYQQQQYQQYQQPMGPPPGTQPGPEIALGPTPGQAPGGPESLPMKN